MLASRVLYPPSYRYWGLGASSQLSVIREQGAGERGTRERRELRERSGAEEAEGEKQSTTNYQIPNTNNILR
ncbi:hypothetical protein [Scytonema millei]|uniref:Uncharacterized protein n=1 Tax=Scytonema millei VB511283 TaxID=1245923 RepID=A0A9X5I732_9CYAN|nr:hypothetical protein [Scytonema millei]NHC38233.1 hypothetical protein [Scytonema millei VB511283]